MPRSLPRFCLVGLSNTVLSFALFTLLVRSLAVAAAAQAVAYSAGILWSFFWNRRWAFAHRGRVAPSLAAFAGVQLLLLGLSTALIGFGVDLLRLAPTLTWMGVMGSVTLVNYLLLRRWVFRRRDRGPLARGRDAPSLGARPLPPYAAFPTIR